MVKVLLKEGVTQLNDVHVYGRELVVAGQPLHSRR